MISSDFTAAVPEIPVRGLLKALDYYVTSLGFHLDWSDEVLGLAGISRGDCRLFISDATFRSAFGNAAPVVIWLNLNSDQEVDELYRQWITAGAEMLSGPEAKPWNLYEFSAVDIDGNKFRVFHNFGPSQDDELTS